MTQSEIIKLCSTTFYENFAQIASKQILEELNNVSILWDLYKAGVEDGLNKFKLFLRKQFP